MFALSVSISTSSSPSAISSPTCFSHCRIVPSSMESDSRGMTTSGIGHQPRAGPHQVAPSSAASAAFTTCSVCGIAACSSRFEYGMCTSAPVTRWTGASR